MAQPKLKQIELIAFRGASHPITIEFDPDKKITMIFGENGTGKSSVVDAFSFLCEQKLGSLDDRSGAENKHITSILGKPSNLRIKLTTTNATWEASLSGAAIAVVPPTGYPNVRILRRAQILSLIDRQPKERFDALRSYIEVRGIDSSERGLRDAVNNTNKELDNQTRSLSDANDALEALWNKLGSVGKSAVKWAAAEAAKDITTLKDECSEIARITNLMRDSEQDKRAVDDGTTELRSARTDHDTAVREQKAEEQKVIGQNSTLLGLLRQARDYISGNSEAGVCPVCQKPADADTLTADLESRIASMSNLSTVTTKVDVLKKAVEAAQARLSKAEEDYAKHVCSTATALATSKVPPVVNAALAVKTLTLLADSSQPVSERLTIIPSLLAAFPSLREALTTYDKTSQNSIAQHAAISLQLDAVRKRNVEAKATGELYKRLKSALVIVEDTRKQFVSDVLAEISSETERLYSKIHPHENIGKIRLDLDQKKIGSLHLRGDFYTQKDIAPQSLFSESHLDTLGLCVFLALAKKYKTEETIIILDDVVTSVDRGHLDRFIEMLHDEEQYFSQIIVTTHYQPWRDRYRHHRAPGGKVHFIELRPWSLDTGIRVQGIKLCLDELRHTIKANPFDRQIVASKAGIFLENMLEFMARLYECRLPITSDTGYTLRQLTDCFNSKLLTLLKAERISVVKDANGQDQATVQTIPLEPIITSIQ